MGVVGVVLAGSLLAFQSDGDPKCIQLSPANEHQSSVDLVSVWAPQHMMPAGEGERHTLTAPE